MSCSGRTGVILLKFLVCGTAGLSSGCIIGWAGLVDQGSLWAVWASLFEVALGDLVASKSSGVKSDAVPIRDGEAIIGFDVFARG